ncbi:MAG TPA: tRNA (adenine-N1)-methyltransferase [Candidatus Korarchaeota archaeon]|nr:tRNA (adenine-N1)-methyltransferase [Candidatus Korarchaeota archaeon]
MPIQEGDLVLFVYKGKKELRKIVKRVRRGEYFHTHLGTISHDDVIGLEWGSSIKTSIGGEILVLKPTLSDFMEQIPRRTQIIYPKDAAFMIIKSGVLPGSLVVEGGTGSGSLTLCLSFAVGESGLVVSYETNKEFLKLASRNLRRFGVKNVILKNKDIRDLDEKDVDAIFLDIGNPWDVFEQAFSALKPGGTICCFVPSYEQMRKTVLLAKDAGFGAAEIYEVLLREYEVNERRTRPKPWMIGHTGFIIIIRKIVGEGVR